MAKQEPNPQVGDGVDIMEKVLSEDKPLFEQIALKFSEILTSVEKRFLYQMCYLNEPRRDIIISLDIVNTAWYSRFIQMGAKPPKDDDVQEFINTLCLLTVSDDGKGREGIQDMLIGLRGGLSAISSLRKEEGGLRRFFPR